MKDKRWGFKEHISLAELKLLFQQGHMKISPEFFSWLHLAPPLSHAHQEIPKKHLYLSLNFLLPSDHGAGLESLQKLLLYWTDGPISASKSLLATCFVLFQKALV